MNLVLFIQEHKALLFLFRLMSKIIKVFPYYLVEEIMLDESQIQADPLIDGIELRYLDLDEVIELSKHPEVKNPASEYIDNINRGCLCLGGIKDGHIVGYTWCECTMYQYKKKKVYLKENEAYLFDARTFKKYRGKNIAPFLRYQLYKRLYEKGMTTYYSLTIFPNTASLKFKQKLGGRVKILYLYICLFSSINIHLPLRKYT